MSVAYKICRRLSPRSFALAAIFLTILLCIYYTSYTTEVNRQRDHGNNIGINKGQSQRLYQSNFLEHFSRFSDGGKGSGNYGMCKKLGTAEADVNTLEVFKDFEFQVGDAYFYINGISLRSFQTNIFYYKRNI